MRIKVICLFLSAAAVMAALPVARTETVPLVGIKLVAESVASPGEVAAAVRNGTRSSRTLSRSAGFAVTKSGWITRREDHRAAPDLVAVAMR